MTLVLVLDGSIDGSYSPECCGCIKRDRDE